MAENIARLAMVHPPPPRLHHRTRWNRDTRTHPYPPPPNLAIVCHRLSILGHAVISSHTRAGRPHMASYRTFLPSLLQSTTPDCVVIHASPASLSCPQHPDLTRGCLSRSHRHLVFPAPPQPPCPLVMCTTP
jgi:hypothetical protein